MNKFVIYFEKEKYYWILYAYNGEPIARGYPHTLLSACYNEIDSLRKNVPSDIIEQFKDAV